MRIVTPLLMVLAVVIAISSCGGPPPVTDTPTPSGQTAPAPGAAPAASIDYAEKDKLLSPVNELMSAPTDQPPVTGDAVVLRLEQEPGHLNMLLDTADAYSRQIGSYIFDALLERDNRTSEIVPSVAESYEIADDHLTYTFKLRQDVKFSDGVPLTGEDVLFTLDKIMDKSVEAADLRNYYQDISSYELVDGDKYTIRFHCSKPYFRHLDMLGGIFILPKHIYGTGDFNTHPYNRTPVGSGPYIFETWDTNQQIVVRRNPDYWNKERAPRIERLIWKIIVDDDAAFQVLARGDLDHSADLTPEQWVNQVSAPEFQAKFHSYTSLSRPGYVGSVTYIAWNLRLPKFQDRRVRQALTMLLDRQTILETIWYGLGEQVTGPEFSRSREYDASIQPWPFDPKRAAELLAEAGWKDTDNDGILDKDGEKFTYEYMIPSGSKEFEQLATVYKEELARAGISMTIQLREWASFIETITKRKFESISLSWAIPLDSEPYQIWHSSQSEQGSNYPGYNNPEVDKLLDDIRIEFDREKRIPLFHRFHQIMHEDQAYTFLFNRYSLQAVDKRYRNVYLYSIGVDPREWWVPADLQRYAGAANLTAN